MARVNIIAAITLSRILQKSGFDMRWDADRAPYPIAENQTPLAMQAPSAKYQRCDSN